MNLGVLKGNKVPKKKKKKKFFKDTKCIISLIDIVIFSWTTDKKILLPISIFNLEIFEEWSRINPEYIDKDHYNDLLD